MTTTEILKEVTDKIKTIASNQDLDITLDSEFENIAEWDSLNTVDLEMELETAMNISFETGEFTEYKTVKELVDALGSKLK